MFGREPTVLIGGLAEIARAIVPLLVIFGYINWTDNQVAQVMLMIGVVVGVAEKVFARSQVVSTVVADKQIEIAKASDVNRPTDQIIKQAAKETS
jgi:hypothetical protein